MFKFKVGDTVRVSKEKMGVYNNRLNFFIYDSIIISTIVDRLNFNGYLLQNKYDDRVTWFYEDEIIKVFNDAINIF